MNPVRRMAAVTARMSRYASARPVESYRVERDASNVNHPSAAVLRLGLLCNEAELEENVTRLPNLKRKGTSRVMDEEITATMANMAAIK